MATKRSDPTPEINRLYKLNVATALARHFGKTKDEVKMDAKIKEQPMREGFLYSPLLQDDCGFDKLIFSIHLANLPLDVLISPPKFSVSEMYLQYLEAEESLDPEIVDSMIMAVHFKSNQWILKREHEIYDGTSAVLIRTINNDRFTFLPIKSYLEAYYPVENTD